MTLTARDWAKEQSGLRATLSLQNGDGYVIRDRVTLGSSISRNRFAQQLPEDHRQIFETVLISLEDYLRAKIARSHTETADNTATATLTEEEKQEALNLLKDAGILQTFLNDTKKLGCVGEEENKATLYLSYTSRNLDRPISITIKGESSSGKNFLATKVAQFFPPEAIQFISSATPKAFFYLSSDLSHQVVIIAEATGAQDADYSIRTLESEGETVILVPEKDPLSGRIETKARKVKGPVAFVQTTTKTHLHPENETRHFDLYVDESEKQTEMIFEAQDAKHLGEMETNESLLKVWRNAQRLLEPLPVQIPYVKAIKFPTRPLRVRRDRQRFCALIEASAQLHQYQRGRKDTNGQKFIVANLDDYEIAHALGVKILDQVLKGATPKCEELVKEAEGFMGEFTRTEMEQKLGWDRKTVTKYLNEAVDLGCLDEYPQGQGKATQYRFVKKVADAGCRLLTRDELEKELSKLSNG